jgi:AraC-like DNA-binding protein
MSQTTPLHPKPHQPDYSPSHTPTARHVNCNAYAQVIAHQLELKEGELHRLLRGTGLPKEVLYSGSDTYMDGPQLIQVIENALRMSPDPTMGLRCAGQLRPSTHGPVGFLTNNAPDLFSALNMLEEFGRLKPPFIHFKLDFDERWLRCELDFDEGIADDIQRVVLEAVTLAMQTNIESFIGGPFTQGRFQFAFATPDYQAAYADYFHSSVTFDNPQNVILIPGEFARRARTGSDPNAYVVAHNFCLELLEQIPDASLDIADRVRHLLLTHSVGSLTEEDVARALFISKRTLARRLAVHGLTYRQLRETLLSDLAGQYLRDQSLSVEAIAAILGYHDAANFRRAFRRWHQLTPSAYRRQFNSGAATA